MKTPPSPHPDIARCAHQSLTPASPPCSCTQPAACYVEAHAHACSTLARARHPSEESGPRILGLPRCTIRADHSALRASRGGRDKQAIDIHDEETSAQSCSGCFIWLDTEYPDPPVSRFDPFSDSAYELCTLRARQRNSHEHTSSMELKRNQSRSARYRTIAPASSSGFVTTKRYINPSSALERQALKPPARVRACAFCFSRLWLAGPRRP